MNKPQQLPCTDEYLEALYIRSCFGVNAPRQNTHLADDEARLAPEDCAVDTHRKIVAAFHTLIDGKQRIDPSRVREELLREPNGAIAWEKFEHLTRADGPSVEQVAPMVRKLREKARQRRKYEALLRAASQLARGNEEAADEHVLHGALEGQQERTGEFASAHDTMLKALEEAEHSKTESNYLRSGMPLIDCAVGSFRRQTCTTIGGSTSSGKSSLALAWAVSQARRGIRVGIISTEDPECVWGERLVAHMAGVNPQALHGTAIHIAGKLEQGAIATKQLPITFAYELNRPLNDVLRAARHLVRKHRCQILYVDYLQAIQDPQRISRVDFIAGAAARIKAQTQALDVPLVLCSQLSRPERQKPFVEVHMTDLKGSGDIENMSEVVLLLWRDGDDGDSRTLGKLAKLKWGPARPRFELQRDMAGAVVGVVARGAEERVSARTRHGDY